MCFYRVLLYWSYRPIHIIVPILNDLDEIFSHAKSVSPVLTEGEDTELSIT